MVIHLGRPPGLGSLLSDDSPYPIPTLHLLVSLGRGRRLSNPTLSFLQSLSPLSPLAAGQPDNSTSLSSLHLQDWKGEELGKRQMSLLSTFYRRAGRLLWIYFFPFSFKENVNFLANFAFTFWLGKQKKSFSHTEAVCNSLSMNMVTLLIICILTQDRFPFPSLPNATFFMGWNFHFLASFSSGAFAKYHNCAGTL